MAKKDDSGGLMSSAGLVRYFDAENRNAIRIDPKTMIAWAVLFGVLIQIVNAVGLSTGGSGSIVLMVIIAAFAAFTVGMVLRAAIQGEV